MVVTKKRKGPATGRGAGERKKTKQTEPGNDSAEDMEVDSEQLGRREGTGQKRKSTAAGTSGNEAKKLKKADNDADDEDNVNNVDEALYHDEFPAAKCLSWEKMADMAGAEYCKVVSGEAAWLDEGCSDLLRVLDSEIDETEDFSSEDGDIPWSCDNLDLLVDQYSEEGTKWTVRSKLFSEENEKLRAANAEVYEMVHLIEFAIEMDARQEEVCWKLQKDYEEQAAEHKKQYDYLAGHSRKSKQHDWVVQTSVKIASEFYKSKITLMFKKETECKRLHEESSVRRTQAYDVLQKQYAITAAELSKTREERAESRKECIKVKAAIDRGCYPPISVAQLREELAKVTADLKEKEQQCDRQKNANNEMRKYYQARLVNYYGPKSTLGIHDRDAATAAMIDMGRQEAQCRNHQAEMQAKQDELDAKSRECEGLKVENSALRCTRPRPISTALDNWLNEDGAYWENPGPETGRNALCAPIGPPLSGSFLAEFCPTLTAGGNVVGPAQGAGASRSSPGADVFGQAPVAGTSRSSPGGNVAEPRTRSSHSPADPSVSVPNEPDVPQSKYICDLCGRGFSEEKRLTSHKKEHGMDLKCHNFPCPYSANHHRNLVAHLPRCPYRRGQVTTTTIPPS